MDKPMPTIGGFLESTAWILYDREPVDSFGAVLLFVRPVGCEQEGRRKAFEQTNIINSGSLIPPQEFLIRRIRCIFFGRDNRPVRVSDPVYWKSYFQLFINRRICWESLVGTVADPAVVVQQTEWSKIRSRDKELLFDALVPDLSIHIQPCMWFYARMYSEPKWQGYELLCGLEGILKRPTI